MADSEDVGIFVRIFNYLFGANWKTSLSGYIAIAALIIHEKPEWIQWIDEPLRGIIWSWSSWISVGSFTKFVKDVKSKEVTGGSKQQTYSGGQAKEDAQPLVKQTLEAENK